jgi:polyisoprenoid-binding protein YceI
MYYSLNKTVLFLLIVIVAAQCQQPDEPKEKEAPNNAPNKEIQDRIQEDLNSPPPHISITIPDVPNLPKTRYVSDTAHSSISFRTGHWEIIDIIGWFGNFEVVMFADSADFSDAVIFAAVDPTSVKMPSTRMASSVPKNPYIDSEKHPEVTFRSQQMRKTGKNNYMLSGIFQMNGIEKKVDFDVLFNGYAYPGEQNICGFTVNGKINRHDFGITDESTLHSGRKLHNDTIYINMALRME